MLRDFTSDRVLLDLFEYWNHKRGRHAMPARSDIDPVDMPHHVLPHLTILDVSEGAARARYRLVGTAIVRRFGRDPTGLRRDEIMTGAPLEYLVSITADMVSHRLPLYAAATLIRTPLSPVDMQHLFLPLADAAGLLTLALVGQTFGAPVVETGTAPAHLKGIVPRERLRRLFTPE